MRWIVLLLGVGVACTDAGDTGSGTPPVMFRVNGAHLGVHVAPGATEYAGIAWTAPTGGPVRSSPVVHAGTVFVGSGDGRLYALDLETGAVRWRFAADGPIDSSPAVARGVVLFASRPGTLYGVDAGDGRVRWRRETGPPAPLPWGGESGDAYTSSAVVEDDLAIFGGADGVLRAVAVDDGDVRWQTPLDGRIRSTPAATGGRVYVGTANGTLFALRATDGSELWRFATRGHRLRSGDYGYDRRSIQSSPAVAEGTVYVGARDGFLYAVDAETGRLRWTIDHKISWVNTSPAVDGGRVFAGSSDGQFVQALDARTGRELWRRTTALTWASPAVAGGAVYFGDASGALRALDAASGEERWSHDTGSRVFSSPWVESGRVIFGADDGRVRALKLGPTSLDRAVYWEPADSAASRVPQGSRVRDYLLARGYRPLDAETLGSFLSERARDRRPSVVVFAVDALPASTEDLFRRYLDAGGKVVWLGLPPGIWPRGEEGPDLLDVDREAPRRLLGVDFTRAIFDRYGARPTPAGARHGLAGWWLGAWGADTASVDVSLAIDEQGLATSWLKGYGGDPGTGFLQHYAVGTGVGPFEPADLSAILLLAETRP